MIHTDIFSNLILPEPLNERERDIFNSLQESHRNIAIVLSGLSAVKSLLFSQSESKVVANTTTETTLTNTGSGKLSFGSNELGSGKVLRVSAAGVFSTTGTPSLQFKLKLGATTILDSTAINAPNGVTNELWILDVLVSIRSIGSSGSIFSQGVVKLTSGATTAQIEKLLNTSAATIDTTAALTIDLTATWGTASASNTITCTNLILEG